MIHSSSNHSYIIPCLYYSLKCTYYRSYWNIGLPFFAMRVSVHIIDRAAHLPYDTGNGSPVVHPTIPWHFMICPLGCDSCDLHARPASVPWNMAPEIPWDFLPRDFPRIWILPWTLPRDVLSDYRWIPWGVPYDFPWQFQWDMFDPMRSSMVPCFRSHAKSHGDLEACHDISDCLSRRNSWDRRCIPWKASWGVS